MVSKKPQSSKSSFAVIKDILSMGTVDIPEKFKGTGAPGNTLEYLLDIEQNNIDAPDLKDWEVKFHGGKSLITLFHKDPEPEGIVDKMVNTFGWDDKHGNISFRHTIKKQSKRGFTIMNTTKRIEITNDKGKDSIPYWEYNTILNSVGRKLSRLIVVHGIVSPNKRQVTYKSADAYWDLKLTDMFKALESGIMKIEFDARTNGARGSSIRNHGTKFRIKAKDIVLLYENHKVIG